MHEQHRGLYRKVWQILYPFIVLFYFVLLFIMHMFIVLILRAYKWLPPFAADV